LRKRKGRQGKRRGKGKCREGGDLIEAGEIVW